MVSDSTTNYAAPKNRPDSAERLRHASGASSRIPESSVGVKKTILFISRTGEYGGTEKHLLQLVARLGPDVHSTIVCLDFDPYTQRLRDTNSANVSVRSEPAAITLRDWMRLFRAYRADAVVLVYGWLQAIQPKAAIAARMVGVRNLYALQHLVPPPLDNIIAGAGFRRAVDRLIGNRPRIAAHLCDKTICVSDAVRNALVTDYRFPSAKTFTIRNGVSLAEFTPDPSGRQALRAKLGVAPDQVLLLCSARLSWEKGLEILLAAMDRLKRSGANCKCVVVGEGYLRPELEEQIRKLELTDFVNLLGFQPDIRPYLNAADILVLTSYKEGLPLSVLEAMACGLPCVVTNAGGSAEAVTHGVNGFVAPLGDDEKIAAGISHLISHPEERARMSAKARSIVCESFNIEHQMGKIKIALLD